MTVLTVFAHCSFSSKTAKNATFDPPAEVNSYHTDIRQFAILHLFSILSESGINNIIGEILKLNDNNFAHATNVTVPKANALIKTKIDVNNFHSDRFN